MTQKDSILDTGELIVNESVLSGVVVETAGGIAFREKLHASPRLEHIPQRGLFSSHFTRLRLHVSQPLRDLWCGLFRGINLRK